MEAWGAGSDRQVYDFFNGGSRAMTGREREWFGDRSNREHIGPFDQPQDSGWGEVASLWGDLFAWFQDRSDARVDDIAHGIGPDRTLDHDRQGPTR